MTVSDWTKADTERAEALWHEYQTCHDLTSQAGRTAGIDPVSRDIWFGESIQDVIAQRNADGIDAPLYFVRIGSATYYRKVGYRGVSTVAPRLLAMG